MIEHRKIEPYPRYSVPNWKLVQALSTNPTYTHSLYQFLILHTCESIKHNDKQAFEQYMSQGDRERAQVFETLNFCEKGWHKVDSGSWQ